MGFNSAFKGLNSLYGGVFCRLAVTPVYKGDWNTQISLKNPHKNNSGELKSGGHVDHIPFEITCQ